MPKSVKNNKKYQMIIYNVTIKVEATVAEQWLQWMKEEHLADMMSTGLFSDYRMSRLMEQDEAEGVTFVVQYHTDSIENYQSYLDDYAPKMRQKGLSKFADKMVAFRTVMEVIN
jgi:ribosomal protein L11 methylase PrmA